MTAVTSNPTSICRREMMVAAGAAAVAGSFASIPMALASSEGPVVKTKAGPVRGASLQGVNRFLGIPYAQAISGKNRFAPPQPMVPWTEIRDAQRYADNAPQPAQDIIGGTPVTPAFSPPSYVRSGDECLALNIWTPDGADGSLPVMVWLHGGGWTSGSGSCAIYDGENLARRGDVIIVTLNHRLGASGFTDLSRLIGGDFADSSNLSIKDMVAALEWVRDNIAGFGGNPDCVTIFGESGGGFKVSTLLGVPSAKGLFHRAIIESGPLTRFMTPDEADAIARSVLDALGIRPDNADALHTLSHQDIIRAQAEVMAKTPLNFQAPGFPSGFWPVIDGDFITGHVFDPDAAASSLEVPLMIGQNGTEFTLFMLRDQAAYSLDEQAMGQRVARAFGEDNKDLILATYKRDFPQFDPSGLWFRIYSDYAMGTLMSEIMDVRSAPQSAPVYAYRFEWQTPIENGKLYSPHTIEIPFVFDNATTRAGVVMTGGGARASALANTVSELWVSFARTGKPAANGTPEWPDFSSEGRASLHINTESRVAPYMDSVMVDLFHGILWQRAGVE
nr:carboxylesterase family protein [uncultured Cohaesibacter sp.]